MKWIIQNNIYNEDGFSRLINALKSCNSTYSIHKIIPFSHSLSPDASDSPDGKIVIMGSSTLSNISKQRGWLPGTFLNRNFSFSVQKCFWGEDMLNYDAQECKLSYVPFQDKPFFIRPVDDGKSFAGEVMDWGSFIEWSFNVFKLDARDSPTVTADTVVMVCSKKEIYSEVRCWVINSKVVTSSEYKTGTRVIVKENTTKDVIEFAESLARKWSPHKAFVMDIARTPKGLKIIEVNNLNSSGFYAANVEKLVLAIEKEF